MNEDEKKCVHCAEIIKKEAVLCRFCNRDLPSDAKFSTTDSYSHFKADAREFLQKVVKDSLIMTAITLALLLIGIAVLMH